MNYPSYDAPPPSLRAAVNLIFLGAGLSVVAGLVNAAYVHQAIARGEGIFGIQAGSAAVTAGPFVTAVIVSSLVDVGLWLWMAYANRAGHNWARITGTVFFGIASIGLLALIGPAVPISKVFSFANWLIGLGAVVYLWRPDSSAYFNRHRGGPGGGYPMYPPPSQYPPPPPPGGWTPYR